MTFVQGLFDFANPKMDAARNTLETCRKKKEVVDTKKEKGD